MIMRMVRNQPRSTWEDLVNDLKAAGSIVTKKTIGNTLCHEGLKSCSARKISLLKQAHAQTHLKFANDSPSPPSIMEVEILCFRAVFLVGQLHRIKGTMNHQCQGIENVFCYSVSHCSNKPTIKIID